MIEAVVFDLDGTLVQTERLKALSYARAAVELRPDEVTEDEVVEAFKDVVGLSRRDVAQRLLGRFDLGAAARARCREFGVRAPWQAYVQVRLRIYETMLEDPEVLRSHRWPHAIALLQEIRERGCRTALATMSHCEQARRILQILELADAFDFVATRDDVERGKPDPEIYRLTSRELRVPPDRCLVIEDSPAGVEAALAAGMDVVAVATPFTRQRLREMSELPGDRLVEDPARLAEVVRDILAQAR